MTRAIGIILLAFCAITMTFILGLEAGYQLYRPIYRPVVSAKPAPVAQGWWI